MKSIRKQKQQADRKRAIIKAALKIFIQDSRWSFLKEQSGQQLGIILRALYPLFIRKINSLKEIADLSNRSFTMADFHAICRRRNIRYFDGAEMPFPVKMGKADPENVTGFYVVNKTATFEAIWVKAGQSEKETLATAAHEIAHFLLHRSRTMRQRRAPCSMLFRKFPLKSEGELMTEFEADLLMAFLLADKSAESMEVAQ